MFPQTSRGKLLLRLLLDENSFCFGLHETVLSLSLSLSVSVSLHDEEQENAFWDAVSGQAASVGVQDHPSHSVCSRRTPLGGGRFLECKGETQGKKKKKNRAQSDILSVGLGG